MIVETTIYIFR